MPPADQLSPAAIILEGHRLARAGRSEWLLTNGLGGFAMGSAWGIPMRRYHGMLIGAMKPPLGRFAALNAVDECLVVESVGSTGCVALPRHRLSVFRFRGSSEASKPESLVRFVRDQDFCRWDFRPGGEDSPLLVTRELRLGPKANIAVLTYRVIAPNRRAWLELRPLVAMRDFHALRRVYEGDRFGVSVADDSESADRIEVRAEGVRLSIGVQGSRFIVERNWWRNFEYARDIERGQDGHEDLFCPGAFVVECGRGTDGAVEVTALASSATDPRAPHIPHALDVRSSIRVPAASSEPFVVRSLAWLPKAVKPASNDRAISMLAAAADQFIVARPGTDSRHALVAQGRARTVAGTSREAAQGVSIIAGYPWFSDWGRDACIALPGLLLSTRRFAEARATLEAFAALRRRGLIPNCFDNGSGEPEYNAADAPLWFIHSACAYLRESGDNEGFRERIKPACVDIARAYLDGTDFGIGIDPRDGLVRAGNATTQLTWMDAKRDGVVFTPRHGKPVELSALWCSVLAQLAEAIGADEPKLAADYKVAAAKCGESLRTKFWNKEANCLFDRLSPTESGDKPCAEVRPNMIFAVSLPHGALAATQQRGTLDCVKSHLLTPMGLRTLDPGDPNYKPRYEGTLFERDRAYHNGTVWPWLIGPYAEAVLRVGGFSKAAKREAREGLRPLLNELLCEGEEPSASLLQLPEIYDGDESPERQRRADGCMAQAWSVAELLRVLLLIEAD